MLEKDKARLNRPGRKLSTFMCRELLYDYLHGRLDGDRKRAVEQALQSSQELQLELGLIRAAEIYCDRLALTRISSLQIENLKNVRSFFSFVKEGLRYRNWPDILQWSSQALVLSALVAVVALVTPWDQIHFDFVKRQKAVVAHHDAAVPQPETTPQPEPAANSRSEAASGENKNTAKPAPAAATVAAAAAPASPTTKPAPVTAARPAAQTATTEPAKTEAGAKAMRGFIYRMLMDIPDVESVTPRVRAKIEELGGVKAGQVELGWKKTNPSGSYFHFTVPEKNYDELVKTLEGYGRVRIYKNAHERIMPAGQIRIILWIEERAPDAPQGNDGKEEQQQPETPAQ